MLDNPIQNYIKEYCNKIGASTDATLTGSYIQNAANFLGENVPENGSWLQAICKHFGITAPVNGSWLQALATLEYNCTEPVNGSWWYAILLSDVSALMVWGAATSEYFWGSSTSRFWGS